MEILETEGTKIAYQLSGNERGPKLILIHGLYVNSDCWKYQLPWFERDYHILRFDLHGHGRSLITGNRITIRNYVNDMSILLKHLGWDKDLIVVGHSLGGMVAQVYAHENQDKIRKLVIASSYCFVRDEEVSEVLESFRQYTMDQFSRGIGRLGLTPYNKEDAMWIAKMMRDYLTKENAILATYASAGFNFCDHLRDIEIPTLIIVGENDQTTPIEAAEMMHNRLPRSELNVVENANHLVIIDHSQQFNETVSSFLNQVS
ncbi:MAG: alpha/beta fold hydrolase [Candidatus Thorarchaeota archaeon]